MNQTSRLYPINPAGVSDSVTEPSASFKREVKKVMTSIFLFFAVYIIIMLLAVALAIGCVLLGWGVITASTHLLIIIAGAGIMSIGVMVVIFLIKFIFSIKKVDEGGMLTVSEGDQPELFAFIKQLTEDTQTHFPKKIVLSPEVNASVFYNDSFWSMFFPVKKNLMIGLGLVNTVTLSEFKAVMAHEFGHFSQRSMKLGSFVYNVNKAVYNMLYENNDFGKFLHTWGNLHWAIGIFVWITVQIIKGIQSVLQGMYSFINKNYMSLSREMEFHADAVAASVSGGNNLASALKKLEISDACYNSVIQKADVWLNNKQVFENIYGNHKVVMHQYAVDYNLPLQNGVPLVSDEFIKRFQLSKLNIKNQWASHPATEDREKRLDELGIHAETDERSAWVLFSNPEKLQQQLSQIIYVAVPEEMKEQIIDEQVFRDKYVNEIKLYRLPAEYNGYYDDKRINNVDLETLTAKPYDEAICKEKFNTLFSDEKVGLGKLLLANESDAGLLEAITDGGIDTKTFDYDGVKYEKREAVDVLAKLKIEIEQQKKQEQSDEEEIMSFFFKAAKMNSDAEFETLKHLYAAHFEKRNRADKHYETAQLVVNTLSPLLQGQQVSIEAAEKMASELRQVSTELKLQFGYWLDNGFFDANAALKEKAAHFINAQYQYFAGDSFIDFELSAIHKLVNDVIDELAVVQFKSFKNILEYQYKLYLNVAAA